MAGTDSGKPGLAGFVALAYTLVIVFASLQPFSGWRAPSAEVLGFLAAWPRYITAGDVILNIAAYLPLGAMLFAALRPSLPAVAAFVIATLLATLLSLGLESAQMFLPARIASSLDLLANSAGAGIGAMSAWMLAGPALARNPLAAMRREVVRTDAFGDCGLIVVAAWILIQFHQAPLVFGGGDWREMLHLTPLFAHTPQTYLLAESAIAALATTAIGLLISLLLQPQQPAAPAIGLTIALALTAKSIAAATLARAAYWLQWLTPGVGTGIAGGLVLFTILAQFARTARALGAVICLAAGVFIVNGTPENPYQAAPAFLLSPQPTHLLNFSYIVRLLSQAWPLAAVVFLLALARRDRAAAAR
jgi:VanZ family protein